MAKYLKETNDWMMACVNSHHSNKIHQKAQKYKRELRMEDVQSGTKTNKTAVNCAKAEKLSAKNTALLQLEEKWREKPLHGKFHNRATQADVE